MRAGKGLMTFKSLFSFSGGDGNSLQTRRIAAYGTFAISLR
jgi:hypothetical protein